MKIIVNTLLLIIAIVTLSGCIDQDEGKMQGGKAASDVTK
jgi:hypothetical protein